MEWFLANAGLISVGVLLADKIVKLTPTKYDDLIVDSIKGFLSLVVKRGK